MLVVTTPAADRTLLTVAELRSSVSADDGRHDARLIEIERRVAAAIANACRVASDGATSPTLRVETLTETLRLAQRDECFRLSRKPITEVVSVSEDGTTLSGSDYEIAASSGFLRRLVDDAPGHWAAAKIVVVYRAGWAVVPDDLKMAASKFVQAEWQQGSRDPLLKRVKVEGVSERDYWVEPTKHSVIPSEVMDILKRGPYLQYWVA